MEALERYQAWLTDPAIDDETKQELEAIRDNEEEIYDRFYQRLEFGTGGMRGKMGAGDNRMNVYTIRLATQAFANHLKEQNLDARGAAIAYDTRSMSHAFAQEAAAVLVGNGIPVYIFSEIAPTPLLSFAVRYYGAGGGIMITASHNPPIYNGFKVYGQDGVQLLPPEANAVSAAMEELPLTEVSTTPNPEQSPLWRAIGSETFSAYYEAVEELLPTTADHDTGLAVLYTPLHGTGAKCIPALLQRAGFSRVDCVEEQMTPDGDFPTVELPNPEEEASFASAFAQAGAGLYDMIIATDPDADRIGVAVWDGKQYQRFSGNQMGVLLTDYMLTVHPPADQQGVVIKTIVTTEMIRPMAEQHGVSVIDTLTGFKYIGEQIGLLENAGQQFLFGFEESYGYLAGSFVRDKDAVLTSLLAVQMAAFYKRQGQSLLDRLETLYQNYGYYRERLRSYAFGSPAEADKARALIQQLRSDGPHHLADEPIVYQRDYLHSTARHVPSGETSTLALPSEDVLQWETASGDQITLRPSGTEPKMKLYILVRDATGAEAEAKAEALETAFDAIVQQGLAS